MRIILSLFLLLWACPLYAFTSYSAYISADGLGTPRCIDQGAYLFCWDGGYSDDTDVAWFTSGGATKQGTTNNVDLSKAYGIGSGVGVLLNADADYIQWAVAARDGFDEAAGTLYIWIKPISSGGGLDDKIFVAKDAADNEFIVTLKDDNTVRVNHNGQANIVICNSTNIYTDGEWVLILITWSIVENKVAIKIGSQAWEDDVDATAVTAFVATADSNLLGNLVSNFDDSHHVAFVMVTGSYYAH